MQRVREALELNLVKFQSGSELDADVAFFGICLRKNFVDPEHFKHLSSSSIPWYAKKKIIKAYRNAATRRIQDIRATEASSERHAHPSEYNRDIYVDRSRARWTKEESLMLAKIEVSLIKKGTKFMNQALWDAIQSLPGSARFIRTFDSLKSHRKQGAYRDLVQCLLEEEPELAVEQALQEGPEDERSCGSSSVEPELPEVEEQDALPEVAKEVGHLAVRGVNIERPLNDYIRDALIVEPKQRRPYPARKGRANESNRRQKKRLFAQTQDLSRKRQADCARAILDGEKQAEVADVNEFLSAWERIMTGPPLPDLPAVLTPVVTLDFHQRAFQPVDGCAENVLLLSATIQEARRSLPPLYMLSVDLSKAFDRVSTAAILEGARCAELGDSFVQYIKDLYESANTILSFEHQSKVVQPTAGVSSCRGLTPAVGRRRDKKMKVDTTSTFSVAGRNLPKQEVIFTWKYLGIMFDPKGRRGSSIQQDVVELLARIERAPLKPQQRMPEYSSPQSRYVPDLVIRRGSQCVVVDAQVVGTNSPPDVAHERKVAKYSGPDFLQLVQGKDPTPPVVTSVTMTYRGVWSQKSARELLDLGLGRADVKILTAPPANDHRNLRAMRRFMGATMISGERPSNRKATMPLSPSSRDSGTEVESDLDVQYQLLDREEEELMD
ncbi:hypothetical protein HPB47_017304 [Ixodes persulcatus]|uniref:Uncharacterized protein n=1 Tax=Ixodes persulcatus TaxID=34615 RepID=A0AC60R329_IXOPE|nr:hypothetical protein HPB47_017304 [Ixodes persulcatus]